MPTTMTAAEFTTTLDTLGWSLRHLATRLDCDHKLVVRWAKGTAPVPSVIATWLSDLARHHQRHPAPTTWRQR